MDSEPESFRIAFQELTGHRPFPWQERLYECFIAGRIPDMVDLPTGLGKTSVIAVWLLALIERPDRMPRRLVYVVNRRTVVDQTTAEVERVRDNLPSLGKVRCNKLAISTLRGQFADNHEWSADPSRPAVVCGTVDMIGSRLLFEGYRIGFKSRPMHAGYLGQDALLVHDEAHLEPAFQRLIETIQSVQKIEREQNGELAWPRLRVMALSATARSDKEKASREDRSPFGLTDEERRPPEDVPDPPTEPIHHLWQRLTAKKRLRLHEIDGERRLAEKIAELAVTHDESKTAVLVFVRKVEDVDKVVKHLTKGGVPVDRIQTLTGTMRGYERNQLLHHWVLRCLLQQACPLRTVYLVCTSAGEVGVNISADHMICDVSTFDSMAQRLGRVNRFGSCDDTQVDVVHPTTFDDKTPNPQRKATLALLQQLDGNASPKALSSLKAEDRFAAFAPAPTIVPATDILFDAWAMTSIRDKMPGRPAVGPYLHGLADWEPPRASVAWREEVGVVTPELIQRYGGEDFARELLADYPLKPHELLTDRADRLIATLQKLADAHGNSPVWLIDEQLRVRISTLGEIGDPRATKKPDRERLQAIIADGIVLLPPSVGGLSSDGRFNADSDDANDLDVSEKWFDENVQPRRCRVWDQTTPPAGMAIARTIDTHPEADEFISANSQYGAARRYWHWYVRLQSADDAIPAATRPIKLQDHVDDVVRQTRAIVEQLGLPDELKEAITLAARWHDLGKKREIWQRQIGNPCPTDWHAKSGRDWRGHQLTNYRHEFGSLLDVLDDNGEYSDTLAAVSDEMRDVVLHLIASHHGYARPHFSPDAYDPEGYPTPENEVVAYQTMRRYARMQRRYGRWGLAYLESLLRSADWAASAHPSTQEDAP